MFDFKGKNVLVTGGSRGIGREICKQFAKYGAKVIVSSRKLEACEKVVEEIEREGGEAIAVAANMGKMDEVMNLANRSLEECGYIDVLVNNAATNPIFGPILNTEEKAWDKIMDVNLKGPFFLSLRIAQKMIEGKGGSIINIASTAGLRSWPGLGVYGISKGAIVQMTRQMAREWAGGNVRVNCVAPGLIDTDFSKVLIVNQALREEALKTVSMNRHGVVSEIAGLVLFLASDAASYITGQIIVADGGGMC
ncbi:MAG: glucose 1-dehydrogenase [Deltaproteobacteria bacterium]|nr:glucose 1-dehydrogenase [Deltaproteobacteria bacterium]